MAKEDGEEDEDGEIDEGMLAGLDDDEEEDEETREARIAAERKAKRAAILAKHHESGTRTSVPSSATCTDGTRTMLPAGAGLGSAGAEEHKGGATDLAPTTGTTGAPTTGVEADADVKSDARRNYGSANDDMFSAAAPLMIPEPTHKPRALAALGDGEGEGGGRRARAAMDDAEVQGNWDDHEGYYRERVGELIDGRWKVGGVSATNH